MRLSISKHIYSALINSAVADSAVGNKIFPIATKNEVQFTLNSFWDIKAARPQAFGALEITA